MVKKSNNKSKKNGDKCFQYAVTVALNYQNINNHPEKVNNINSFIKKYNWKKINFPSMKKDWKKFESNNKSIALNILYLPYNTEEMRPAYVSKYNFNRKNQVILLMITDGKKRHYLAVRKLSASLRGVASNHFGDFYCLNCLHSYRTKDEIKKHENICRDHDSCYLEMPNGNDKILKYNHGEKSMKAPIIIYVDLEFLLEKINTCHNNPKKLSTTKINKHTTSGYSLFTHCSFDATKNKLDHYRGRDSMETCSESNKYF